MTEETKLEIECVQWQGENSKDIFRFIRKQKAWLSNKIIYINSFNDDDPLLAHVGDWIIKMPAGDCMVCKKNDFPEFYHRIGGNCSASVSFKENKNT